MTRTERLVQLLYSRNPMEIRFQLIPPHAVELLIAHANNLEKEIADLSRRNSVSDAGQSR